jgi:hypothetical protein
VVYLTIRSDGGGQVQLELQGRLGTFEAISATKVEIATGRQIRVVGVRAGALLVEPANAS